MSRLMRNIIFRGYKALFSKNCCTILGHLLYRKKVKLRYGVKEALFLISFIQKKDSICTESKNNNNKLHTPFLNNNNNNKQNSKIFKIMNYKIILILRNNLYLGAVK